MIRRVMVVLWSSFLVAVVAEGLFFSLFDPLECAHGDIGLALSPIAAYTIGFFFFWGSCAFASTLTCYLLVCGSVNN